MAKDLSFEEAAELKPEDFRRYHLSELLRHARARAPIPPELAAEHTGVFGMTQEQAARGVDMSVRHYRDLERGNRRHPDPRLLEEVVRVLGMSAAERSLLHRLAGRRPPLASRPPSRADVRDLQPTLDGLGRTPALITDIAWNLQAWNRSVVENLQDPTEYPEELRNTILWLFTPEAAGRFPRMPEEYELLVGRVHAAYLAGGGRSPALKRLAERLLEIPFAAEYWNAGALALEPGQQQRLLDSPVLGTGQVRTLSSDFHSQGLRMFQFAPETTPEQQ